MNIHSIETKLLAAVALVSAFPGYAGPGRRPPNAESRIATSRTGTRR